MSDYLDETDKEERLRRPLGEEMQCRNCMFWSLEGWKVEKELLDPEADLPDLWGECRRHAPAPTVDEALIKIGDLLGAIAWAAEENANVEHGTHTPYDFRGKRDDNEEVWFWPKTQPYAWCGEFKVGRNPMSEKNITKFEKMHEEWTKKYSTPHEKSEPTPSAKGKGGTQ